MVKVLIERARTTSERRASVDRAARELVAGVRRHQKNTSGLHAFLRYYDLSSQEGVVLMCLAESLLRIPDDNTADRLITDKLTSADWERHLGESPSLFVNASTWALMLTGKLLEFGEEARLRPRDSLARLAGKLEEPVIRNALKAAMRIMAHQFVMARDIDGACRRAAAEGSDGERYSFDMLGESALTSEDAMRYEHAYADAISAVGNDDAQNLALGARPSISIKLSALCPRYEYSQRERAVAELNGRMLGLASAAAAVGIGLTLDAEEADRLAMSLQIFEHVYCNHGRSGWDALGIAVQAYQKRALPLLYWLQNLAAREGRRIHVRLVKGAYWDTEIKRAQQQGLADYPVFTRKCHTDVSYLACVRVLLEDCPDLTPQFASHNAHTIAYVQAHARGRSFEFQRLHGMGEALYETVSEASGRSDPVRVYAPVGAHEDLLPYLVRRLLENGANTSFVNQIADERIAIDDIVADPVDLAVEWGNIERRADIPLPVDLFSARRNSSGINFANQSEMNALESDLATLKSRRWHAGAIVSETAFEGSPEEVFDPAKFETAIGAVSFADAQTARAALNAAAAGFAPWNARPAGERAQTLEGTADLIEKNHVELVYLCICEAGKTLRDAHVEVREAVDFLRYYAGLCRQQFAHAIALPGPTGERNELYLTGRGPFVCISPWNFPLAIFTGQIAAALAAGNSVVAKPAEQTSLVAYRVTELFHQAGVPAAALAFTPGDGDLGAALVKDPHVAGVAFTGSTETARVINRTLAARDAPIAAFIAETGGLNAMIADSSALPEQLIHDVVKSAFNSAGQRCSALRVLYLQEEIAERSIALLRGTMDELVIGDPMKLTTDVGPVIDRAARERLDQHLESIAVDGILLHRCKLPEIAAGGFFFAPAVVEIEGIERLEGEVFGPILHLVRYRGDELDHVIDAINATGYGLTLGIHSRIESTAETIRQRVRTGNCYVNRDMIGAVVGCQPFGGMGLSGTGPKAGGPHTLLRYAVEKTSTVNTAAIGGDATLLNLSDDSVEGEAG